MNADIPHTFQNAIGEIDVDDLISGQIQNGLGLIDSGTSVPLVTVVCSGFLTSEMCGRVCSKIRELLGGDAKFFGPQRDWVVIALYNMLYEYTFNGGGRAVIQERMMYRFATDFAEAIKVSGAHAEGV
jgi:hypothetical protein